VVISGIVIPCGEQIERDVGDHVFLAADQAATADRDENVPHVEVVLLRGPFGVAQKLE
jgi:hypothetical protein